jgi:hypothetical protein
MELPFYWYTDHLITIFFLVNESGPYFTMACSSQAWHVHQPDLGAFKYLNQTIIFCISPIIFVHYYQCIIIAHIFFYLVTIDIAINDVLIYNSTMEPAPALFHVSRKSLSRPRFLSGVINANDQINQVKHCWHWSNLGQSGPSPRKPHQQSLMTLLIKSTPTLGPSLVKELVKTPVKPLCLWTSSKTFAAFSKFRLNTSKSANIKVVRCFEGHNFLN